MWKRSYGIPALALSLGGSTSCGPKAEDDDDYSDVPLYTNGGPTGGGAVDGSDDGGGGDDGGDPTGADSLIGVWRLTTVDGRPVYSSYTVGDCTYTSGLLAEFDFTDQNGDRFYGSLYAGYAYTAEGDGCRYDYDYGYGYGTWSDATADRVATRSYEIVTPTFGIDWQCEMDETYTAIDCDLYGYAYHWER
jgi:hypothetical protein